MKRFFSQRQQAENIYQQLQNHSRYHPAERVRKGWRWKAKQPEDYLDVCLEYGYLFFTDEPYVQKKWLDGRRGETVTDPEVLGKFYELALVGTDERGENNE